MMSFCSTTLWSGVWTRRQRAPNHNLDDVAPHEGARAQHSESLLRLCLVSSPLISTTLIMDFFASDSSRTAVSAAAMDAPDPFAEAIGRRFSGAAASMLTARLIPDESPLGTVLANTQFPFGDMRAPADVVMAPPVASRSASSQAATTLSSMTLNSPGRLAARGAPPMSVSASDPPIGSTPDAIHYTAVAPKDLAAFLALAPPLLILDVRSSGAHTISHVRGALSLSVPSTLLKRPKFSLTNLATMIASPSARKLFDRWPDATRILVYDADVSRLADGSGVLGLLRKFEASGFKGELAWLVGGHNAVARSAPDCLEAGGSPSPEPENEAGPSSGGGFVHAHHLPQSAFQQSTTFILVTAAAATYNGTGSTSGMGNKPRKLQASNPFFDNIRQNQELSHVSIFLTQPQAGLIFCGQGITDRIPLSLPEEVLLRKDEIPVPWVRDIVENSDKETGVEALAMQFYRYVCANKRLFIILNFNPTVLSLVNNADCKE